jgi:hypothetical protein
VRLKDRGSTVNGKTPGSDSEHVRDRKEGRRVYIEEQGGSPSYTHEVR